MKVCFSVGQHSARVINSIKNTVDNIEFYHYDSVHAMIRESTMRHIFFDRIIFSEKVLSDIRNDLVVLNDYVSEYSSKSTVILICKDRESESVLTFKDVFKSHLSTPVVTSTATVNILTEFIKSDVSELKEKYFKEELKEVKTVTNKYNEKEVVVEQEPEKKGFFKGLFGGKKNNSSKNQPVDSVTDGLKDLGNAPEKVAQKIGEGVMAGTSVNVETPISLVGVGGAIINETEGVSQKVTEGSGSVRDENLEEDFSPNNLEDDDLGVGDFGEQHSDTDFFDNEDEEELNNSIELESRGVVEELNDIPNGFNGNIEGVMLVTGERGQGVTSYIAEYALNLQMRGVKVLIVDLDYRRNGILSFIDTDRFVEEGYFGGLSKLNYFIEDGIYILSNGYGYSLSSRDISNVDNLAGRDDFDCIIIDCPLDCLNMVSISLLQKCKVSLVSKVDRGSVISTVLGLTDRSLVKPEVEDYLYDNASIIKSSEDGEYDFESDKVFYDKCIYLGRSDWFNKLI